jgi:hypothetical protein
MLFVLLVTLTGLARADILSTVNSSLIDHVGLVSQLDARGTTRAALLDSVVEIGNFQGSDFLDVQAGFTGDTQPDPNQPKGINYTAGLLLRVDPFIKAYVTFPDHWDFLKSIQHGPFFNYDFRDHQSYVGYQLGMAFKLEPKK